MSTLSFWITERSRKKPQYAQQHFVGKFWNLYRLFSVNPITDLITGHAADRGLTPICASCRGYGCCISSCLDFFETILRCRHFQDRWYLPENIRQPMVLKDDEQAVLANFQSSQEIQIRFLSRNNTAWKFAASPVRAVRVHKNYLCQTELANLKHKIEFHPKSVLNNVLKPLLWKSFLTTYM